MLVEGRRITTGTALALALAAGLAPAAAAPAPVERGDLPTLRGPLATGGRVAFELRRNEEGKRRIVRWRWRNLPIRCNGVDYDFDGHFRRPWLRVRNRAFYGRAKPAPPRDGFAEVHGSFPDTWREAEGTFEVQGDTSVGDDCSSGAEPVAWTAERVD